MKNEETRGAGHLTDAEYRAVLQTCDLVKTALRKVIMAHVEGALADQDAALRLCEVALGKTEALSALK
jgi:hypothetical protein